MKRGHVAVLGVLLFAVACGAGMAEPCSQLVTPVFLGEAIQLNAQGCVVKVDSLWSRVEVLADTFRVCGHDTVQVGGDRRKFIPYKAKC